MGFTGKVPTAAEQDLMNKIRNNPNHLDPVLKRVDDMQLSTTAAGVLLGKGNKWLDGDTIASFISILIQGSSSERRLINPFLWHSILPYSTAEAQVRTRREIFRLGEARKFLLPTLLRKSHWILIDLDIDPVNPSATYYDSYHNKNAYTDDSKTALKKLNDLLLATDLISKPLQITRNEGIPLQSNEYDCGSFTCSFARALILNKPMFNVCQRHMDRFRVKIFLTIIRHENTPTPPYHPPTNLPPLRKYQPDTETLCSYYKRGKPFVDLQNGRLRTSNALKGYWRDYLKLDEILDAFSKDKDEAWVRMHSLVKDEPQTVYDWFKKSTKPITSPGRFLFCTKQNANKLRKMFKDAHPERSLPSPPIRKKQRWLTKAQKKERYIRKLERLAQEDKK